MHIGADVDAVLHLHDVSEEILCLRRCDGADHLLDARDGRRAHGEFGDAHAEQQHGGVRVARHLAAHARPDAALARTLDRALDEPQDGGVERVVEMRDLGVAPVDRKRVLDEVVRADAEEVDVGGKERGDDGGGGCLDHDANLYVIGILFALVGELDFRLLDEFLHALDLADADDHRHHHGGFAVESRTQDRFDLRQEEVVPVEADAQCTVTEERVLLGIDVEVGERLVPADVHRTDDADMIAAFLDGGAVNFELILFGRDGRGAHEDELRAEESNALRAVGQRVVDIHVGADVRRQLNAHAVLCDGGEILERGVVGGEFFLLVDLHFIERTLCLGRADDDVAAAAVEDDLVAVADELDLIADAEDGRDRARLGDDDDVARRAARAQDDARDLICGHSRDDGRLDLLSAENELACTGLGLLHAEDIFGNALAHIAQIDCACGEVFILHLLKDLRLLVGGIEDALRRTAAGFDFTPDIVRHHGVLHHHAVCLKDRGLLRLILFAQALDGCEQGLRDGCNRRFRFALFLRERSRVVGGEIAVEVLPREHDCADGNPRDHTFSTDGLRHIYPPLSYENSR